MNVGFFDIEAVIQAGLCRESKPSELPQFAVAAQTFQKNGANFSVIVWYHSAAGMWREAVQWIDPDGTEKTILFKCNQKPDIEERVAKIAARLAENEL